MSVDRQIREKQVCYFFLHSSEWTDAWKQKFHLFYTGFYCPDSLISTLPQEIFIHIISNHLIEWKLFTPTHVKISEMGTRATKVAGTSSRFALSFWLFRWGGLERLMHRECAEYERVRGSDRLTWHAARQWSTCDAWEFQFLMLSNRAASW